MWYYLKTLCLIIPFFIFACPVPQSSSSGALVDTTEKEEGTPPRLILEVLIKWQGQMEAIGREAW